MGNDPNLAEWVDLLDDLQQDLADNDITEHEDVEAILYCKIEDAYDAGIISEETVFSLHREFGLVE